MPFNIGPGELIIVLIIALIVVGPGKLPDVGSALGKSIKEFRKAATDVKDVTSLEATPAPAAQAPVAPVAAAVAAPVAAPIASVAAPVAVAVEAAPIAVAAPVAVAVEAAPAESWPSELSPADEQAAPSA